MAAPPVIILPLQGPVLGSTSPPTTAPTASAQTFDPADTNPFTPSVIQLAPESPPATPGSSSSKQTKQKKK